MSVVEESFRGVSGVGKLCRLRLQVLKQVEERLQANRKAAAEAGRGHGL